LLGANMNQAVTNRINVVRGTGAAPDVELRERRLRETPTRYRAVYAAALAGKASPRQAIKAMCYACMGFEGTSGGGTLIEEVRQCTSWACPLFATAQDRAKPLREAVQPRQKPRQTHRKAKRVPLVGPDDSDAANTKSDGLLSIATATDSPKLTATCPTR
jgi:hypothetical protein